MFSSFKAEINGRQEAFKSLKEFGHRLLQQKHSEKDLIESKLQRLEELRRNLIQVWEERRHMLTQCRDLQVLNFLLIFTKGKLYPNA